MAVTGLDNLSNPRRWDSARLHENRRAKRVVDLERCRECRIADYVALSSRPRLRSLRDALPKLEKKLLKVIRFYGLRGVAGWPILRVRLLFGEGCALGLNHSRIVK